MCVNALIIAAKAKHPASCTEMSLTSIGGEMDMDLSSFHALKAYKFNRNFLSKAIYFSLIIHYSKAMKQKNNDSSSGQGENPDRR